MPQRSRRRRQLNKEGITGGKSTPRRRAATVGAGGGMPTPRRRAATVGAGAAQPLETSKEIKSKDAALKASAAAEKALRAAEEVAAAETPAQKEIALKKAEAAVDEAAIAVEEAEIIPAGIGMAPSTGEVAPGEIGLADAETAGNAGGGRTMQGFPVFSGGTHVVLDTVSDFGDKIVDTQKVTAGYFTGGGGQLNAIDLYTGSLADSNEVYYFNITQTHPDSSSAETQFSVAYGHAGGSGSSTDSDNIEGATEAIYEQWASTLLGENEISGGFTISKAGSSGVHNAASARDEDIYVLVGKRARFKDRINKKNWTIILSGSDSSGNAANPLYLTDDSDTVGTRYNIVSGSDGTVHTAATTRTYGWIYPEMGTLVFSAAELSASIPGTNAGTNMTASFDNAKTSALFLSSSGFAPNLSTISDSQNALRFVNCLQPTGAYLKFRSEEDQVSVSYFCRTKAQQLNFSNSPTFVSGSYNEIRERSMWGNPTVYITGVGLYNDGGQLVAIGKLSTPLKKNFSSEATVKVKLTY